MTVSSIAQARRALSRHVVNPVVRGLLRTPARRLVDAHVLLLRYRGRRTGREFVLPVGYVRDGDRLLVAIGRADGKTWWRNFATPRTVELVIRRNRQLAAARLIPSDSQGAAHAAAAIGATSPRMRITGNTRILELRPLAQGPLVCAVTNGMVDVWPHDDLEPRSSELPPTAFRRHEVPAGIARLTILESGNRS